MKLSPFWKGNKQWQENRIIWEVLSPLGKAAKSGILPSIYSVRVCINLAHPASAETDPRAYQQPLECLVKPVLSLWEAYNTPAAFWHASLEPFCVTYPPIHLHTEWQGRRKFSTIMRVPFAHERRLSLRPSFSKMHYSKHHSCHSLKIDSLPLPLNITIILQVSAFKIQRQELRFYRRWADIYWNSFRLQMCLSCGIQMQTLLTFSNDSLGVWWQRQSSLPHLQVSLTPRVAV